VSILQSVLITMLSDRREQLLTNIALSIAIATMCGFIVYFFVKRDFQKPFQRMLNGLRTHRESYQGDTLVEMPLQKSSEVDKVIGEFNALIKEQQKVARQVKVKQQYLEYAAHHDPLTHLSNRLMFETQLRETVSTSLQDKLSFSVFLVDLDNFKFFNDQYGHEVGDRMVIEVGARLNSLIGEFDLVARLDGDEFVVLNTNCSGKKSTEKLADQLMETVTAPYEYRGFTIKASVSVGIACFPEDVHADQNLDQLSEEIVNNAAVALQDAKGKGKNQHQLFNESMRVLLTERIRLEEDLKQAMQEEQFEVYYQPKINLQSKKVMGAEALVRWNHPTQGRVPPDVFVPVAEEAGFIIELGEWILRTACRQNHSLQKIGYAGLSVAVNISAVQFTDGNLLPMVRKALKDSRLEPNLLELEITESAVMHDPEEVINSLHELGGIGTKLAIDDFGTGYSSLSYLKRFPVDTLKIDRAFITDVSSDSDDVAIVETVLGLGNHFNMSVVAEGVETQEQLDFLSGQGCDLAQGFLISKPLNFAAYVKWLEAWPHGLETNTPEPGSELSNSKNVTPIRADRKAS